jgi:hypothetical protein
MEVTCVPYVSLPIEILSNFLNALFIPFNGLESQCADSEPTGMK